MIKLRSQAYRNCDVFKLDQRLEKDCFVLGKLTLSQLLLMNNAALPWFILVPETTAVEICDLAPDDQAELVTEINMLSILVQGFEGVEKLNIGAIGNIVNQLHVHIVGRYPGDYCWPGVVWGRETPQRYSQEGVDRILSSVRSVLGERLTPA